MVACDTILSRKIVVGAVKEVTEGIFVPPTNTDLMQHVGFPTPNPTRERLSRDVVRDAIGLLKEKLGLKGGTIDLVTELRGGGESGGTSIRPENHVLLESALGTEIDSTAGGVDAGGSTDNLIELGGGQGSNFAVGSIVLINGEVRFVTAVNTDQLTLNDPLSAAPVITDVVAGGFTYAPTTADHPPFSMSLFIDAVASGPEFRGIGCRIGSLSISNYAAGQIPQLSFSIEMLDFTEVIGTLPANPVFNDTEPAVLIDQFIRRDGTNQQVNTLELEISNTISRQADMIEPGGVACMRVTERSVEGSLDPFTPSTNVDNFDDWDQNVSFQLQTIVGDRVSVGGDYIQGSIAAIWLKQANFVEFSHQDSDGIVQDALPFKAHVSEGDDDIFIAFI